MPGSPGLLLGFGPSTSLPDLRAGWDEFQNYCHNTELEYTEAAREWHGYDLDGVKRAFWRSSASKPSDFETLLSSGLSGSIGVIDYRISLEQMQGWWVTTVFVPAGAIELNSRPLWPIGHEAMQSFVSFFALMDGREWILWQVLDGNEQEIASGPVADAYAGVRAYEASDWQEAARLFRKAAEVGVLWGQHNFAQLHHSGKGVPQDLAKAAYWFEQAAVQGYPPAQHNIAYAYSAGNGVPVDKNRAAYWYRRAASIGLPDSMQDLGLMHVRGEGVPQDYGEALYWFLRGAERGHPEAQQSAAAAYFNGWGTEPDGIQGLKWLEVLSLRGFSPVDKARFERLLTVEERREARRLAADWLARFQTQVQRQ
jgi:uncharacterized protein